MAFYRNQAKALNTGFVTETVEGTLVAPAQTQFVGDWDTGAIQPKYDVKSLAVNVGQAKLVTGKVYGELSGIKMPVVSGNESLFYLAGGGVYSTATLSTVVHSYYDFGGGAYDTLTGANKGRLTSSSITANQYDGKELIQLSGARPSSLKISAKSGEILMLESTLQGNLTRTASAITYFQKPVTSASLNVLKGTTLTIGGTSFEYSNFELDFKPTLRLVESGTASTGYSAFELTNNDPQITLDLFPGDPAVSDLYALMATNTPVAFVYSVGSTTGNTYNITANVQFNSQETSYDSNLQVRKLVLVPVYNASTAYQLRIDIC